MELISASVDRRNLLKGAAALGALAACGATAVNDGFAVRSAVADEAADRIVIGRATDSDNLDPVTCVGNANIFVFNLIVEGLVKTSDDGSEILPCLATDWEVSEDGTTYTFNVQEGLLFADGSPVTAEDWQWTFDRAIETETSNWHMCVENIDHVECPDDTTVIVVTKEPAAATLANLCIFDLGVQSKAYFDKVGEQEYQNGPIGTGPYMVKEWKRGEYLTLAANPNYREEGKPLTAELEFKVVADDSSRALQLQGSDIDIATDLPFSSLAQLENDDNCIPVPSPSTITRFMALNVANEYLSDVKVRQALGMATDPQQLVDAVLFGYGTPIGTIFSTTSKYCDTSLTPNVPDIEGAKALLAEAGYPEGFDLGILIRGGNALEEQVAMVLMQQWAQIGVNLVIDSTEATSYKSRMYGMEFDTLIDYWSDDIQDPSEFMQFVFDFDSASGFDTNFEQPAEMVALNDAANVAATDEERIELYTKMQQEFAEQAIWIPLFSMPFQNAVRVGVEGFVQTPLGNYRFDHLVKA